MSNQDYENAVKNYKRNKNRLNKLREEKEELKKQINSIREKIRETDDPIEEKKYRREWDYLYLKDLEIYNSIVDLENDIGKLTDIIIKGLGNIIEDPTDLNGAIKYIIKGGKLVIDGLISIYKGAKFIYEHLEDFYDYLFGSDSPSVES